jgi:hypothetical protein
MKYSSTITDLNEGGQIHAPTALFQRKQTPYPLDRRLGGPQSRSRRYGEEKKLALARNRTPAVQPVLLIFWSMNFM